MTRPTHRLKTDPEAFAAVLSGAKTFEIRFNDRNYQVGDGLLLQETATTGAEMKAGAALVFTGRETFRTVSHVLTGYGLADGWCCLSFASRSAIFRLSSEGGGVQFYNTANHAVVKDEESARSAYLDETGYEATSVSSFTFDELEGKTELADFALYGLT